MRSNSPAYAPTITKYTPTLTKYTPTHPKYTPTYVHPHSGVPDYRPLTPLTPPVYVTRRPSSLLPPVTVSPSGSQPLLATLVADERFSTLVAAVTAANITQVSNGELFRTKVRSNIRRLLMPLLPPPSLPRPTPPLPRLTTRP